MKRTYYILEHVNGLGHKFWAVHKRGILSFFGFYNQKNYVTGTRSYKSLDECRQKLISMTVPLPGQIKRTLRL